MAVGDRDSSWPFNTYPNSRLKVELTEVRVRQVVTQMELAVVQD